MRTLGIHASRFEFTANERAGAGAETLPDDGRHVAVDRECLVVFVAVEAADADGPSAVASQLVADTQDRARQLGVRTAVVYPYVHLTDDPARPRLALRVLKEAAAGLTGALEVIRAPFGWYKAFDISCIGHALSEWSGRYAPAGGEPHRPEPAPEPARPRAAEFVRFLVADARGDAHEVGPDSFADCPVFSQPEPVYRLLRQFVSNELVGGSDTGRPPAHIGYMQRHDLVDYCDVSEKGHYKWYPKGLLVRRLILDYAARLAREWGAFEMLNPIVIRGDHNVVGELMGEFHERDYEVDGGRGVCYLRYASDPLAFPFMQRVRFTRRQSPLKVYEEATCFRNEQDGEVSGLKRVRAFTMTDMHAACASEEQARSEFEALCLRFARLMDDVIAPGRWVLGWEGTVDFFEANRRWLLGLGASMGAPAFFKLMPRMSHYYAIKNEYQAITEDASNVQVSTVQWDVKDGERFGIGYVDDDGRKHPCPVIIHASSFGSIERTLCVVLENIAVGEREGRTPMLPLWLSPTQARLVPVSDRHLEFALELCERLSESSVRVDVDDRNETVGRKVRDGEREWVPYLLIVGDKEKSCGRLAVRSRESREQTEMSPEEFAQLVAARTAGMPFRSLPLDPRLSRRPLFR
jgi:threonyl-tRNA synthetase